MIKTIGRKLRGRFLPPKIVKDVIGEGLTYLDRNALTELYDLAKALDESHHDGVMIEAGCALGGSAIVLAAAKSATRALLVYDVFGMIPEPSSEDDADVHQRYEVIRSGRSEGIAGHKYYGYQENLLEVVTGNFSRLGIPVEVNNVRLIKGLFQDTMATDERVLLAHLDGDWYDSVTTCLHRIVPRLVSGGVIVVDDYHAWSGCRKAVDDYFADKRDCFEFEMASRLHILKR